MNKNQRKWLVISIIIIIILALGLGLGLGLGLKKTDTRDDFIGNFYNVKKVLNDNKKKYHNDSMGPTIDGMMSFDEHKVVLTCLQDVLNRNVEGDIIELGCYSGNTTIMMQKLLDLNNSKKKIYVYDSFEGFPETHNIEDKSQDGKGKLAFSLDNYILNIEKHNVKMPIINKGFFSDIPDNKYPSKICFVFYDGDLYQSTLDALNKVYKKVVLGGTLIFDDFQHPGNFYPGVKKACLKYFNDDRVKFVGNKNLLGIKDEYFFVHNKNVSQGIFIKK